MAAEVIDWVDQTYRTFIKDAEGIDPTDPVAAIQTYFNNAASEDLKARCKASGKTAATCWDFIVAVAHKIGGNCHIDPTVVYAMAMHYFEDVPFDWRKQAGRSKPAAKPAPAKKPAKAKNSAKKAKPAKADKPAKQPKARKPKRGEQMFFFNLLEESEASDAHEKADA